MNIEQVCEKISKAIQAVEAWHSAQRQLPNEAAAAKDMFLKCYPNRAALINSISEKP